MNWNSYNWTELELEPVGGEVEPYGYQWDAGEEAEKEEVEEGDFREVLDFDEPPRQYTGGRWGEPGWVPPQRPSGGLPPNTPISGGTDDVDATESPRDKKARKERERIAAQILEREDLERQAKIAEEKSKLAMWESWRKKYAPSRFSRFLKGTGRTWKGVKEVAGPRGKLPSGFYVGKPIPGLYVPKVPTWRPTTEFMPAGEAHKPHLGVLRAAGSPPPTARIKAPFRDVQRFESLGPAMSRLRQLEKLPEVDKAVYAEIKANGDVDTPGHVKSEVKRLGFSSKEVDVSLKRLRDLGLITKTGKELVVT